MTESRKTGNSSTGDDLDRLRQLILGENTARLEHVYQRVSDPDSRTSDVAEVLPDAINRVVDDPVSKPQIERPIVETIQSAIRNDADSFAEALFPVLGPAIRRAVADTLKSLVQRINIALEHSFTIKGLRWRMEAARSGVPFGQIVLRETMLYAVQEVFLIQPGSGLVLASVRRDDTLLLDEDAFSAMLSAIQAFIQDSFGRSDGDKLRSAELGDRTLWVVNGPGAVLACLITGSPPHEVRDQLSDTLETLHAQFGDRFDQPPETLAGDPAIKALLQATLTEEEAEGTRESAGSRNRLIWGVVGLVLLSLLAWSAWSAYQVNRLEHEMARRFETEPGYLLTSHKVSGGHLYLAGLRDPLAEPPESILQKINPDVDGVTLAFRPYQSLEEEIVMRRLRAALNSSAELELELIDSALNVVGTLNSRQYALLESLPGTHPVIRSIDLTQARLDPEEAAFLIRRQLHAPDSVTIRASGGRIEISGVADPDWFGSAAASAEAIGGWPLDFTPLRTSLEDRLETLHSGVNGRVVLFTRMLEMSPAARRDLDTLSQQLVELVKLASALETDISVRLTGYTDGVGSLEKNQKLALMRAQAVQSELVKRSVNPAGITLATGSWQSEVEDPGQRKVVVEVVREPVN